jgi:SAM-dependent methyltransferase
MTDVVEVADPETGGPVAPDPSMIMQIGLGFWPAKALLAAIELGLFTALGSGPCTGEEVAAKLQLRSRAVFDFLDALVALRLLDREGSGPEARYRNTPDTGAFLDANSPQQLTGFLEMANARLYGFWGNLAEALQTGKPQTEVKLTGRSVFEELYSDPEGLEQFMNAMTGISAPNFHALAEKFDFSRYQTVCDVGGATGQLSIILAGHHPHLRCTSFDLPAVEPIARRTVSAAGLDERVHVASGDFFTDPLPGADVITMGMILHDWNLARKLELIQAAYRALPPGGALIAVENIIDDDRRENVFGLMMSLNMLIEFGDAFDFTGADFGGWCRQAGFHTVEIVPLAGPASAAIAYK